jgi:tetratricopeptide (TPR) repeat protein
VLRQSDGSPQAVDLGRQLGARWVATGSYQRAGHRLRITPRLVEVNTGEVISTAKMDGSWDDVFELQDRVVAELMKALDVKLDTGAMERIAPPETLRLEAYEHYAQGRMRLHQLGKTSLEDARQHFDKAIRLDPLYAMAHSGLGATYCMRFIHRTDPDDLTHALGHLERARELDPELADPYPWLSYAYMRQGKLEMSRQAGQQGIRKQPDHFQTHYFYAVALMLGHDANYSAAAAHLLQATGIEPLFHPGWLVLAWVAKHVGDYARACEFADKAIQLEVSGKAHQSFYGTHMLRGSAELRLIAFDAAVASYNQALARLGACDHMYRDAFIVSCACGLGEIHLRQQRSDVALANFRRGWETLNEYPRMLGRERLRVRVLSGMAAAYAGSGEQQRARELVQQVEDSLLAVFSQPHTWIWDASTPELCYSLAVAQVRLGDLTSSLRSLHNAVQQGWYDAEWPVRDPELVPLHGEAKFRTILDQLHCLPPVEFDPEQSVLLTI